MILVGGKKGDEKGKERGKKGDGRADRERLLIVNCCSFVRYVLNLRFWSELRIEN